MMYDQYIREDILYLMFYAGVAVLSFVVLAKPAATYFEGKRVFSM